MNQNHDFQYLNIGLPDDILRHKQHGNLKDASPAQGLSFH